MVDHLLYLLMGVLLVMNTPAQCVIETQNATYVESAKATGAVCLDGGPPSYFLTNGSGDGADNWLVFLRGGGWCTNETECLNWGSRWTNARPINLTGIFNPNKTVNPVFYNWNRVALKYCDGSSFMGDVDTVDPETKQYRRGARIFDAVIKELLTKGLADAKNVLLAGSSAGGLATMFHCDRFRGLVPNASRVKCLAGSSFFIRAEELPGAEERESYYSQLVEFHIQSKLKPHPGDEPLWTNCTADLKLCTPGQLRSIRDFGTTFRKTLERVGKSSSRGVSINSCYIHDFLARDDILNLNSSRLGSETIMQAIGDWYFDRSHFQEIDTIDYYPLNCYGLSS